jgi:hypothetical protein
VLSLRRNKRGWLAAIAVVLFMGTTALVGCGDDDVCVRVESGQVYCGERIDT